ncbi:hypothetical protein AKJ16_DCAP14471 [Drosera capensis]
MAPACTEHGCSEWVEAMKNSRLFGTCTRPTFTKDSFKMYVCSRLACDPMYLHDDAIGSTCEPSRLGIVVMCRKPNVEHRL